LLQIDVVEKKVDLQTRCNKRQGKSQNTSQDNHSGHGARCVLLVRVNRIAHNTKDFQNGAGSVNPCAYVPANWELDRFLRKYQIPSSSVVAAQYEDPFSRLRR
jgi:hypothetical protein